MTLDQTHDLVKRALPDSVFVDLWPWYSDELCRIATLAAAHEREECAKVCEEGGKDETGRIHVQAWGCAKDIRARSNT